MKRAPDSRTAIVLALVGAAGATALTACRSGAPTAATPSAGTATTTRDPDGVTVHHDATCTPFAQVGEREHAIATRNQDALARALTAAGLRDAALPADYFDGEGDGWQVVEAADGRTLLSPTTYLSCGTANPWHLAQDPQGDVYVLVIADKLVARHELLVCGCEADAPITCGGAAPDAVRWRWRLPTGADYQGPFSLVVDRETSQRAFAGRPDGAACPRPTNPP